MSHVAVHASQIVGVIWSQNGRIRSWAKRLHAHTVFVPKSILQPSRRSFACCSQWEQRTHLLSASFPSDPQGHQCISALCARSPSSPALLFQLKPPRHAAVVWDSAVIILEVGMECPLFQCFLRYSRMAHTLLWLPPAIQGQEVVICLMTHPSTPTPFSQPAGVWGMVWEAAINVE